MVAGLTVAERQSAITVSALVALCGIAMAIGGRDDLLGVHGVIVLIAGLSDPEIETAYRVLDHIGGVLAVATEKPAA